MQEYCDVRLREVVSVVQMNTRIYAVLFEAI